MAFLRQPDARSALGEPLFRRYFVAACQSTLGVWITRFLLGWIAWDLTETALWVGITSACMLFPAIVLSPLFGVLSDRINPRDGMLGTLAGQGVVAILAAGAMTGDGLSLDGLVALALAVGAISAAHHPLRLALIPRLVARERLPSAIGLSAVVFNTSRIIGPALTGVMIVRTSAALMFLVAGVLFAAAFVTLLRVRIPRPSDAPHGEGMLAQLVEGFRFAATHAGIRFVLTLALVNGLWGRAVIELLPALSGKLLAGTPTTLAALTAAAGAGSIAGGLLLTRQKDNEARLARLVLISLASAAAVLLPIRWADSLWLLVPMIGYLSLATTMAGIGSQALAQFVVHDALRGRVMSLWTMLSMGAPALGGFLLGALADRVGFVSTLVTGALLCLSVVAVLWRQARRLAFATDAADKTDCSGHH